jgi:hypothetical protein
LAAAVQVVHGLEDVQSAGNHLLSVF